MEMETPMETPYYFLFADAVNKYEGNLVYHKFNKYAKACKKANKFVIEFWDFSKLTDINTFLMLEKQFNIPNKSKAIVFSEKSVWDSYQFSKFTNITLEDCSPIPIPMPDLTPILPRWNVKQLGAYASRIVVIIADKKLDGKDKEKYVEFYKSQETKLKVYYNDVKLVVMTYINLLQALGQIDDDAINYSNIFVVTPALLSNQFLNDTTPILISELNTWNWKPTVQMKKEALSKNIEQLKQNSDFSFQVIFLLGNLSYDDQVKYEDFYIKQIDILKTKSTRALTFFYKDFMAYVIENGPVKNSRLIIVSQIKIIPPINMELILIDQFDKWKWNFK